VLTVASAVAACSDLDELREMTPDVARHHVEQYLRHVMSTSEAEAFEALAYTWEMHLVELDQIHLLRSVDLAASKLRRYRAALRRGAAFPPLIGLGGDGTDVTHGVFLCDGYHRVIAMRDVGITFAWMWLAVASWVPAPAYQKSGC